MNPRKKITPVTIFNFLLGRSDAIRAIASTKHILLLSLLFIISSGLARNYDHHLLLKELKWILGPFFMAFFSSTLIFLLIKLGGRLPKPTSPFNNYRGYLRCFLMTAPLAWIYGIPIESLTEPLYAAQFNFTLLIIVSIWRVLIMIRTLQTLFNHNILLSTQLILIPASLEMFLGSLIKRLDIVGLMAGNYLSPAETFLRQATGFVTLTSLGIFAFLLLTLVINRGAFPIPERKPSPAPKTQTNKIPLTTWMLPLLAILTFSVVSISPQERLKNKHHLQQLLKMDSFSNAARFLDSKNSIDFPPHHNLTGRPGNDFTLPNSLHLLAKEVTWPTWYHNLLAKDTARWFENASKNGKMIEGHLSSFYHKLPAYHDPQQFADQHTPGINVKTLLKEYPEQATPAPLPTTTDPPNNQ